MCLLHDDFIIEGMEVYSPADVKGKVTQITIPDDRPDDPFITILWDTNIPLTCRKSECSAIHLSNVQAMKVRKAIRALGQNLAKLAGADVEDVDISNLYNEVVGEPTPAELMDKDDTEAYNRALEMSAEGCSRTVLELDMCGLDDVHGRHH